MPSTRRAQGCPVGLGAVALAHRRPVEGQPARLGADAARRHAGGAQHARRVARGLRPPDAVDRGRQAPDVAAGRLDVQHLRARRGVEAAVARPRHQVVDVDVVVVVGVVEVGQHVAEVVVRRGRGGPVVAPCRGEVAARPVPPDVVARDEAPGAAGVDPRQVEAPAVVVRLRGAAVVVGAVAPDPRRVGVARRGVGVPEGQPGVQPGVERGPVAPARQVAGHLVDGPGAVDGRVRGDRAVRGCRAGRGEPGRRGSEHAERARPDGAPEDAAPARGPLVVVVCHGCSPLVWR